MCGAAWAVTRSSGSARDGVLADVNSATWYRSGNPDGVAKPPKGVRLGGPPRWEKISDRPTWTWFDHRMHPGSVRVGQQSIDSQSRARLDESKIPGRLGAEPLDVTGHVEYRPCAGTWSPTWTGRPSPRPASRCSCCTAACPACTW